ncbi:MAG TPA: alanine racemase [Humisphaera sp.]|nr:alanine racemase [Humisphaera sp.]
MLLKQTLGEPRVLISRSALLHNARVIRRAIGDGVRICAILKADAYGHGAAIVADTLCNFSADASAHPAVDAVAVASIDEAMALPDVAAQVIIFRPLENVFIGRERTRIEQGIREGFTFTVSTTTAAEDLARLAVSCGRRVAVQVMIDTGMTRCGVSLDDLDELLMKIGSRPSLRLVGLCTHFANAEDARDPFTAEQLARFRAATDQIMLAMPGKLLRHAANSAAILSQPSAHLDMVRPGIALYGIDPSGRPRVDFPLKPALKWTAPLISVRSVPQGTGIGYGQTWKAQRDSRIGLVPIGYADGYFRAFSNRAVVTLVGKPAPVVGRVSMDLLTIDLTAHPHAIVGDQVTLLDSDPLSPASVYRLAQLAETLPYEIFCRIGSRVARVAIEPEQADAEPSESDRVVAR